MVKIALVADIDVEPYAYDHKGLIQGLKDLGCDYMVSNPSWEEARIAAVKIRQYNPDLVIHHMVSSLANKLPELIGDKIPQFFWMLDYRPMATEYDGAWPNWIKQGKYLRHICLSNKSQISKWEKDFGVPVTYLPHGCYILPELKKNEEFHYPCVFMGSILTNKPFNERTELLEEIDKITHIEVVNAYDRETRNKNWMNMAGIYHTSDTVLDIAHFWNDPGYTSGRYFYSSGLGACTITKRFPDCEELYPEGIKIYFDTAEEAAEKIKYYQKHRDEGEKIKLKAYEWNKKHHNYKLRFKEIFKRCRIKM